MRHSEVFTLSLGVSGSEEEAERDGASVGEEIVVDRGGRQGVELHCLLVGVSEERVSGDGCEGIFISPGDAGLPSEVELSHHPVKQFLLIGLVEILEEHQMPSEHVPELLHLIVLLLQESPVRSSKKGPLVCISASHVGNLFLPLILQSCDGIAGQIWCSSPVIYDGPEEIFHSILFNSLSDGEISYLEVIRSFHQLASRQSVETGVSQVPAQLQLDLTLILEELPAALQASGDQLVPSHQHRPAMRNE